MKYTKTAMDDGSLLDTNYVDDDYVNSSIIALLNGTTGSSNMEVPSAVTLHFRDKNLRIRYEK